MTVDEEIQRQDEQCIAYKRMGDKLSRNMSTEQQIRAMEDYRISDYHKQLTEWLKELKERREIQDILLQFLVDIDLDICCEELMTDETEQSICEATCNNQTKECWYRWAKMKAREVNDNGDSN